MLSVETIEAAAEAAAQTADADAAVFRPNLAALLAALNTDGNLSAAGETEAKLSLAKRTAQRVEGQRWLRDFPEIGCEAIVAPIFLTGLPRSGTTFFQYLFDRDPRFRLLRTWEANSPSPPPGFDAASAHARRDEETRRRVSHRVPGFAALHLADADGPEECHAFLSRAARPRASTIYMTCRRISISC